MCHNVLIGARHVSAMIIIPTVTFSRSGVAVGRMNENYSSSSLLHLIFWKMKGSLPSGWEQILAQKKMRTCFQEVLLRTVTSWELFLINKRNSFSPSGLSARPWSAFSACMCSLQLSLSAAHQARDVLALGCIGGWLHVMPHLSHKALLVNSSLHCCLCRFSYYLFALLLSPSSSYSIVTNASTSASPILHILIIMFIFFLMLFVVFCLEPPPLLLLLRLLFLLHLILRLVRFPQKSIASWEYGLRHAWSSDSTDVPRV